MIRAIATGVIAFTVATVVAFSGGDVWRPAETQALTTARMAGAWAGDARIAVNWTDERMLRVKLTVEPDGRVGGTIGDAVLRNGRLERNRTAIGRALHVKTDWIVRGDLEGDVVRSESIRREHVTVPLNWIDDHFQGSVHTSGSHFGGKTSMWIAALDLRLDRITPRR